MKRAFYLVLICCLTLFTACFKPEHKVRVSNEYPQPIEVMIGGVGFGVIDPQETTDYRVISEGTHKVTGSLEGSISISGKGKHRYTLTVKNDGTSSITEDK